jgi:hypothetical protein
MIKKTSVLLPGLFLIAAFSAGALPEFTSDTTTELTISSMPEAQLGITQGFTFPFLQGSGPLTAGNNLRTTLSAALTPVSVTGTVQAVWTPIAFLQIAGGVKAGSGWRVNLFGGDIVGIGISRADSGGNTQVVGDALDGLVWRAHLGGTFQFDAAAIFPGDWNHVVVLSAHEVYYRAYTRASGDDSWCFEADSGENQNGFNYYGSFFLGYQMPIFLNTLGILTEMDKYLYNTPGGDLWGDQMIRWTFGLLLNFTITPKLSAAVITQMRTLRNYTNPGAEDLYYRNRVLDKSDPLRLEFYRAALILSLKLR